MKKKLFPVILVCCALAALLAVSASATDGDYALNSVSASGSTVSVNLTAQSDCSLFVGLYNESGKMIEVRSEKITGMFGEQTLFHTFNATIGADTYAKAFLLNPDTFTPLCESRDSKTAPNDGFKAIQYVLIERISIETTVNNVNSVTINEFDTTEITADTPSTLLENSNKLQKAYNQGKTVIGNGHWDPRALVRYSNGNHRTIALDDSQNYRTSVASDNANAAIIAGAVSYNEEGYALDANGNRILLSGSPGNDGNWIAEPFTAGHIVRVSANGDGYRLHAISDRNALIVDNFSISNHTMLTNGSNIIYHDGSESKNLTADSNTAFVMNDIVNDAWKAYVGIQNTRDINATPNTSNYQKATAYIYHQDGLAKVVYVLNAA